MAKPRCIDCGRRYYRNLRGWEQTESGHRCPDCQAPTPPDSADQQARHGARAEQKRAA